MSLFQYQGHTEPVSTAKETVTEDRWHQPWSEPRRFKLLTAACRAASGPSYVAGAVLVEFIFEEKWHQPWSEPIVKIKMGLRAGDQQALAFNETPFPSFSWYANLSEPIRLKVGLHARHQEFFKYQPSPIISVGWFAPFSDPKRFRKGGPITEQLFSQFFPPPPAVGTPSWFAHLSEPVRVRPRLREGDQEFLVRGAFVPSSYTASLDTTEQRDLFLGILSQFNIPFSAYVDIIENDPTRLGNMGIIGNSAQSSILASIVEPETVPSTGSAIATVAGARVAIIIS